VNRGELTVRAVAAASVATSAVALVMSYGSANPLPVAIINVAAIAAAAATMAIPLHEHTPDNGLWRVLLATAVIGPLAIIVLAVVRNQAEPSAAMTAAAWLLDVPLTLTWVLFFGGYPDGKRPVRSWPMLVAFATAVHLAVAITAWRTAPGGLGWPDQGHLPWQAPAQIGSGLHMAAARTSALLTGVLPVFAAAFLISRYRRTGPVPRQQIRVGAVGLFLTTILEVGLLTLPGTGSWPARVAVSVLAVGIGELAVASALLRWRLWIVDRALPRAVILSAVSALITALLVIAAVAWTGRVGVLQVQGAIPVAIVVSMLVQGYTLRLEPRVRHLVYGARPEGFAVLVSLADELMALDPDTAANRIADAIRRGLSVPWAAVWLKAESTGVFHLSGMVGGATPIAVLMPGAYAHAAQPDARLLTSEDDRTPLPSDSAAAATLATAEGVWGLAVAGERPRDPLSSGDVELLGAIAREANLAQENRHLHHEVEANMQLLQERANQLRQSRRRLVAAQDEERRRIERDLHDGAQHDLVALAGRLRQLSRQPSVSPHALTELAEQAEQAMFNLQDLARGIYPSVLTDRGVAAAVRSHVARLPFAVTLDIDPDVVTRRWHKDLEIALYFVVVEALGNSLKHADATAAKVSLSVGGDDVILSVQDNGRGFDPSELSEGSGLQHMADRMSAVGGSLLIASTREAGTRVSARAPARLYVDGSDSGVSVRSPSPADTAAQPAPDG